MSTFTLLSGKDASKALPQQTAPLEVKTPTDSEPRRILFLKSELINDEVLANCGGRIWKIEWIDPTYLLVLVHPDRFEQHAVNVQDHDDNDDSSLVQVWKFGCEDTLSISLCYCVALDQLVWDIAVSSAVKRDDTLAVLGTAGGCCHVYSLPQPEIVLSTADESPIISIEPDWTLEVEKTKLWLVEWIQHDDCSFVLAASQDGIVTMFKLHGEIDTAYELFRVRLEFTLRSMAVNPNNPYIVAVGGHSSRIIFLDTREPYLPVLSKNCGNVIFDLKWCGSHHIVYACDDGTCRITDIAGTTSVVCEMNVSAWCVACCPIDRKWLSITCGSLTGDVQMRKMPKESRLGKRVLERMPDPRLIAVQRLLSSRRTNNTMREYLDLDRKEKRVSCPQKGLDMLPVLPRMRTMSFHPSKTERGSGSQLFQPQSELLATGGDAGLMRLIRVSHQ